MLYQVVQSYFFFIVADLRGLFTNKCMMYTNSIFAVFDSKLMKGAA